MKDFTDAAFEELHNRHPAALKLLAGLDPRKNAALWVKSTIDGTDLKVLASVGGGWDHVSVSHRKRVPNWYELETVKRLCFLDDEIAIQLHVPPSNHITVHPNTLHLWRPHDWQIILPPRDMI
jgi:hypothetical protein